MSKVIPRLLLVMLLAIGIGLAVIYRDELTGAHLERLVGEYGVVAPMVFMLVYVLATLFFLPGSIITLAGGALFGPVWGTLYNLTGATLGAALAFLAARYLAADQVRLRAGGRTRQLIDGVDREGWRFVAFVRLVPLFPFNLLNYALGLTGIRFWHYVVTSYVCMFPGAVAYTYLGYAGREAAMGGTDLIQKGVIAFGLLAAAMFLPRLIKSLRVTGHAVEPEEGKL